MSKREPHLMFLEMSSAAHYLAEGAIPCSSHTLIRVPRPCGSNFLLDPLTVRTAPSVDLEVVEIKGQVFGEYVVGLLREIERLDARLLRASEENDALRDDPRIAKRLLGEDAMLRMRVRR